MIFRYPLTVALLALSAVGFAFAAEPVVVILHPDAATWTVEPAARLLINGKNKVRVAGAGQIELTGDDVKRSTELLIGSSILRVHHTGYLLARSGPGWVTAFPESGGVKNTTTAALLWSGARVQIQTGGGKEPDIGTVSVFAILPGENAAEAAAAFLQDESNFIGVGEKDPDAAFDERMALLVAVAKSPAGTSPQLKTMLLSAMDRAIQNSSSGAVKYSDIQRGLRVADVSEKAFPSDTQQRHARDQLRERKAWIDRRIAILRALDAGRQYDALVDKYGDFEFYDAEFTDVKALRVNALQKSADMHLERAESLRRDKQNQLAMRELKLALLRRPGDQSISDEIEKIRISEAQAHAALIKKKRPDPKSPEQVLLMKHLHYAESAIEDRKFEEASSEIDKAALIDRDSPRVLLTRARFFKANDQFAQAIEVLDQYDGVVTGDDEVSAGYDMRDQIETAIKRGKDKYRTTIAEALKAGDFNQARLAALAVVKVAPREPAFLYDAGLFSAIGRHEQDALGYFRDYLSASAPIVSETRKRADVVSWLPGIEAASKSAAPPNALNSFTGCPSAAGSFYCPISLLPNPRLEEVRGSHKQTATFEWNAGQLVSANTVTLEAGAGEVRVFFDYFVDGKGIKRLSTKPLTPEKPNVAALFTGDGVVGPGDGVYTAMFNNPGVNPYFVEKLLQQKVGVIVSGNSYFHPFVWDGVHVFLAEYDSAGRVQSAREIHTTTPHAFSFQWDGDRLMAITETGSPEGYKRTMQYTGNRIDGEVIQFRGRDSRIEYKYRGDRLTEAVCDNDASIDNRSRRVTFRE